jgi:hypothetical protein
MKCLRYEEKAPADADFCPDCGASLAPYALSAGRSTSRPRTQLGASSVGQPEGTAP